MKNPREVQAGLPDCTVRGCGGPGAGPRYFHSSNRNLHNVPWLERVAVGEFRLLSPIRFDSAPPHSPVVYPLPRTRASGLSSGFRSQRGVRRRRGEAVGRIADCDRVARNDPWIEVLGSPPDSVRRNTPGECPWPLAPRSERAGGPACASAGFHHFRLTPRGTMEDCPRSRLDSPSRHVPVVHSPRDGAARVPFEPRAILPLCRARFSWSPPPSGIWKTRRRGPSESCARFVGSRARTPGGRRACWLASGSTPRHSRITVSTSDSASNRFSLVSGKERMGQSCRTAAFPGSRTRALFSWRPPVARESAWCQSLVHRRSPWRWQPVVCLPTVSCSTGSSPIDPESDGDACVSCDPSDARSSRLKRRTGSGPRCSISRRSTANGR